MEKFRQILQDSKIMVFHLFELYLFHKKLKTKAEIAD